MQVFTVTLRETRVRRIQMVAEDARAAREAAQEVLCQGESVTDVQLYADRQPANVRAALEHLFSRDFMDIPANADGDVVTGTVGDWVWHAAKGADWAADKLPLIGLRLENDRLLVASPQSVPALGAWFKGTPWAKGELIVALRTLPGVKRTNRSLAGVKTRAVMLPLDMALDLIGGAA
jgi:hypothetical protein